MAWSLQYARHTHRLGMGRLPQVQAVPQTQPMPHSPAHGMLPVVHSTPSQPPTAVLRWPRSPDRPPAGGAAAPRPPCAPPGSFMKAGAGDASHLDIMWIGIGIAMCSPVAQAEAIGPLALGTSAHVLTCCPRCRPSSRRATPRQTARAGSPAPADAAPPAGQAGTAAEAATTSCCEEFLLTPSKCYQAMCAQAPASAQQTARRACTAAEKG